MGKHLSHADGEGRPRMVDVSTKGIPTREAAATAFVKISSEILELIRQGFSPKGDVLSAARLAGIMAAKRTPELIPLCHPIPLEHVSVDLTIGNNGISIVATAKTAAKTGVEMEALTAAAVAALTVYDMCKSADREIEIGPIRLERKSGGAGGDFERKG